MEKLKPCLFCDSQDLDFYDNGEENYWVYCKSCEADGPIGEGKDGAIKLWNRRIKEK